MSLDAGARLGRYEIRSKLGEGGMGEVYLARDMSELERTVALKFLPSELASDQKRLQRFIQEAKTVSALNHPNILTIYEFGQSDSVRFIAMEYVDGVTLREEMRERRLKLHDVLDIATQIAAALNAAHEAGVVHRDIKPENVMVRRDHIVKVLDFGLAKLVELRIADCGLRNEEAETLIQSPQNNPQSAIRNPQLTEPGLVMGTASYMSPEQSQGSAKVDHRTDIWSLGVVLYECIAGRVPFEGKDIHRQIIAIQETDPPPLSKFAEGVPERLEEIVEKALAKDPDERYQTAKDLLIDLRNLKRKLDLDAEIERTIAPELRSTSSNASGAQGTVSNAQDSTARTASGGQAQPTSSAEYIVSKIKQHKRGALTILFALVFAAAALSIYFYFAHRNGQPTSSTSVEAIDSIAVLPLVNESHDPNVDWLADGLTESIIYKLSQLPNLKVLARSTVFRYKGKDVDPAQVARELNVRAVLTGRVVQHGDDLTVSAELIDTRDNRLLWGERYERKMTDLNAVQQEISREISERLRTKLSGEERQQLTRHDTNNPDAYAFYLKGRYYWNKRTAESIKKAMEQFQQAADKDPDYALAYVGLADCYALLEEYAGVPSIKSLPKARAALDRALQIDNSLAEAHTTSAKIYEDQWRWAEAEQEYRRAISLNPNYATAHHWFSLYFRARGQFDDALREIKRAQELDPLSPAINGLLANIYILKNDPNSAIEQAQRTIELDPSLPRAYDELGLAYLKQRRYEEAIAEFQKGVELSGRASVFLSDLGYGYAVAGRRGEALQIIKELEEKYAKREAIGQYLAGVYAGLGDREQTFAWLEKDFQQRSGLLPYITWRSNYDDMRSDPRFADLLRRMGLPQ